MYFFSSSTCVLADVRGFLRCCPLDEPPVLQRQRRAGALGRFGTQPAARARGRVMASEFLGLVRSAHCAWPSRGIAVDMQLLPLTAHPVLSPNSAVLSGASQADFLLAALA